MAPAVPVIAVLLVLGVWSYSTSFRGVFVWDDLEAIVTNPHIRSLSGSWTTPPDTTLAGRPIASVTFAVNYAFAPPGVREIWEPAGGGPAADDEPFLRNVRGYHAVNLVVHLLAALALFGVVRRTVLTEGLGSPRAAGGTWIAASVAAIWVAHPVHTTAVTYITQRVESLMGLLYLVTLYCAIRATEPRAARFWTPAAIAACALGMATKEVMVTAPLMVLLWIWLFRPEPPFSTPRAKALLAGLASTWLVLAFLVAGASRSESVGFGLGGWTSWVYLMTQIEVITHYLRLVVAPVPLVFAYAWPPAEWTVGLAMRGLVLAVLLAMTAFAVARRHPAGFAGVWFFLILAPSSSVLPIATEVAAEHRLYLPSAGIIALLVIGAGGAARWRVSRTTVTPRALIATGLLLAAGVASGFAAMTHARNRDYWSVASLMRDTVDKRPADARVRMLLGVELLESRRYAEAEHHLRLALALPNPGGARAPWEPMARMYLGAALCAQQKFADGIPELERALALNPALAEAHAFLGEAYVAQERIADGIRALRASLSVMPEQPNVMRRLAWILSTAKDDRVRDGAAAVTLAEHAVAALPADPLAWSALAAAYAEVGRFPDATATARRALAVAQNAGRVELLPELAGDIALYEAGRPLRQ